MCRNLEQVQTFGKAKLGDPTAGMTDSEQAAYWRTSRDRMAAQNMELGAENERLQRERDYAVRWANKAVDDIKAGIDPLLKALERARPYVAYAVRHDGGIDHCDIAYRVDLEAIDAALSLSRSDS